MIKASRAGVVCPPQLLVAAKAELVKHKQELQADPNASLKFSVYKQPYVTEALQKIFKGKCAFCEQRPESVTPVDIEHFRPKSYSGNLNYKAGYRGYYWLAAEWTNLLIACPQCNRPKNHHNFDRTVRAVMGKHEKFPLLDEKRRATRPGPVAYQREEESRLLIHPYLDDPESFFDYEVTPGIRQGCIQPKKTLKGKKTKMAETSIEVYALHRYDLIQKRIEHQTIVQRCMTNITLTLDLIDALADPAQKGVRQLELVEHLATLVSFTKPDKAFTAMSKQMVKAFIAATKGRFPAGVSIAI